MRKKDIFEAKKRSGIDGSISCDCGTVRNVRAETGSSRRGQ